MTKDDGRMSRESTDGEGTHLIRVIRVIRGFPCFRRRKRNRELSESRE